MNTEAFIFNWKNHGDKAAILERRLSSLAKVTVVNSDEGEKERFPKWIHLDNNAYFAAQWNTTVQRFKGDLLFHIQADATLDDFKPLFRRALQYFAKHNVGIYEPNIDYTGIPYTTDKLQLLADQVYEVPMTDTTCWFIDGNIMRRYPLIDLNVNKYGWGVAAVTAALCCDQNKFCVRDYSFTVLHPRHHGYSLKDASIQREAYVKSLDPQLSLKTYNIYQRAKELRATIN